MEETLFEKIINKKIPATIEHEDDCCVAFRDINPQAPIHILLVPRKRITRLAEAQPEDKTVLGHLLLIAAQLAAKMGLQKGFRIIINNGVHGGETVPHLHVHLIGGRPLTWPPG